MIGVEAGSETTNSGDSGSLSLRGIWEVFYAPSRFFAELKENPKILVPYLVFGLLTLGVTWLMSDLIMEANKQTAQYQRQLEMMGGEISPQMLAVQKYSIIGIGTLSFLLLPLIEGGIALFWGNFVFAGTAKFRQILSVMLYGEILFMIGGALVVPLALAKGSIFVSLSLAALLPNPTLDSVAFVALSKISLFYIWEFIAVSIGLSIIYGFSRNKGVLLAVLSLGLLTVLHVLMSLVGSMFTN